VTDVDGAPAPAVDAAGNPVAWFIEPRDRVRVLVPFLLAHLIIPTVNVLIVQSLIASGATGASLGFFSLVNSMVWGVVVSGAQGWILRRHVPAQAWFWWTAGSIFVVGFGDLVVNMVVFAAFRLDPLTYYRFVLPILRWVIIASAQWMVLRRLVRSAGLWIASTAFAIGAVVVLQSAAQTAGFAMLLRFPIGGLAIGAVQCWCLLQFRRHAAAGPAAPV